jgi:hypothetical protein
MVGLTETAAIENRSTTGSIMGAQAPLFKRSNESPGATRLEPDRYQSLLHLS